MAEIIEDSYKEVYFISDTHLGHENVCRFREQFSSPKEHDEFVLDNILSTVNKRDVLWMLGDNWFFSENTKYIPVLWAMEKIAKSVFQLNLVLGNHDLQRAYGHELLKYLLNSGLVSTVQGFYKYKKFWLSHAPIHECELRGGWNMHGHMHENTVDDPRYFNVCCEHTEYKPISYQKILEIMEKRNGVN